MCFFDCFVRTHTSVWRRWAARRASRRSGRRWATGFGTWTCSTRSSRSGAPSQTRYSSARPPSRRRFRRWSCPMRSLASIVRRTSTRCAWALTHLLYSTVQISCEVSRFCWIKSSIRYHSHFKQIVLVLWAQCTVVYNVHTVQYVQHWL